MLQSDLVFSFEEVFELLSSIMKQSSFIIDDLIFYFLFYFFYYFRIRRKTKI